MANPILAIVGRPNVGKSTFFNKLIGERRSIVEDTPGVTRDRIYGETEWCGRRLTLIDTGGIEPKSNDVILSQMKFQAEIAVESADVILFLCDVRTGVTAADREVAALLKRSGKPVIPVVNKCDSVGALPMEYYEFYELGFPVDPVAVSSVHGTGTGDVLDEALALLPHEAGEETEDDSIKVAVIGKPNAGKSSIINRMVGAQRLIVSDIPGTTRDAVDTRVENEYGKFTFIDTAGIRRQSKVNDKIEKYSVLRARMAVERADVCLLMIDAGEGVTEQDERIAGIAHEAGKAVIILVNKWDSVERIIRQSGIIPRMSMKRWPIFSMRRSFSSRPRPVNGSRRSSSISLMSTTSPACASRPGCSTMSSMMPPPEFSRLPTRDGVSRSIT